MRYKTISDEWRKLNEQMHREGKFDGKDPLRYLDHIKALYESAKPNTFLDYGCGVAALEKTGLFKNVVNYDPGVPEYADDPKPCGMVVCCDVMEHVEPEYVDEAVRHIANKTIITAFIVIALREDGSKLMPDGRNPHLTVENADFWLKKFQRQFRKVKIIPHKKSHRTLYLECWS